MSEQSIQVDIGTAELQGKLQFKYQKSVVGYRTIGVVECGEAMAKTYVVWSNLLYWSKECGNVWGSHIPE